MIYVLTILGLLASGQAELYYANMGFDNKAACMETAKRLGPPKQLIAERQWTKHKVRCLTTQDYKAETLALQKGEFDHAW